jgi:hypothetical protein
LLRRALLVEAGGAFSFASEVRQQWQQYSATQPSVDPNADADRYLNGGNAAN